MGRWVGGWKVGRYVGMHVCTDVTDGHIERVQEQLLVELSSLMDDSTEKELHEMVLERQEGQRLALQLTRQQLLFHLTE